MLTLLSAILVFGVLITVHELGHFFTAKLTGMQVDEFAIGFGPTLYKNKSKGTLYSLRLVPLGGYNKIAGMDIGEAPVLNGFSSKSLPARMLVILAGSIMNFILPAILFFCIFFFGGMDIPVDKPIVGSVIPSEPAAVAGVMPGDRITAINGKELTKWQDLIVVLRSNGDKEAVFTIDRAGSVRDYKIKPEINKEAGRPMIGVSPKFTKKSLSFVESGKTAIVYEGRIIQAMINGLVKIFTGKMSADISGPIGVAQMAGDVASQGILPLLNFIAFLSINLAIINLLPIPALDGGQFVVLLVEGIRGKPLPAKYLEKIQMVGIAIIIAITIFSTVKDLTR